MPSLRSVYGFILGFATCLGGTAMASAQDPVLSYDVALDYDSGYVANTTDTEQTVIAFPVKVQGATWLRLSFSAVELSGPGMAIALLDDVAKEINELVGR